MFSKDSTSISWNPQVLIELCLTDMAAEVGVSSLLCLLSASLCCCALFSSLMTSFCLHICLYTAHCRCLQMVALTYSSINRWLFSSYSHIKVMQIPVSLFQIPGWRNLRQPRSCVYSWSNSCNGEEWLKRRGHACWAASFRTLGRTPMKQIRRREVCLSRIN